MQRPYAHVSARPQATKVLSSQVKAGLVLGLSIDVFLIEVSPSNKMDLGIFQSKNEVQSPQSLENHLKRPIKWKHYYMRGIII